MVVTREYVDIGTMRTFVAAPAAEGAYPGVVFYTDIFQLTEPSLRWAVRLAGYGFVVVAPEIYHRVEPPGTVLEFDDEGKARGQADVEALTTAPVRRGHRRRARVAVERCPTVGAAGHCTGGHLAFRAAFDERVRGTVCWYATGLHNGKLGADKTDSLERAREIGGEILLIWGTRDPHTPQDGRDIVRAGLDGVRFEWSEYDAEHAFGRDIGPRFDPEATDLAFAETVAFFRRTL